MTINYNGHKRQSGSRPENLVNKKVGESILSGAYEVKKDFEAGKNKHGCISNSKHKFERRWNYKAGVLKHFGLIILLYFLNY